MKLAFASLSLTLTLANASIIARISTASGSERGSINKAGGRATGGTPRR
jgi:hypothetical protein